VTHRQRGAHDTRDRAHTGDGHRHLAIAVLLYNRRGAVLLQRRKHAVFDDVWDVTGATHPLVLADGTTESLEEAARRCLRREYEVEYAQLAEVGSFAYFAKDADGLHCENEHCTLFVGELCGPIRLNPEVAYGCAWVSKASLLREMEASPTSYSPWARLSVALLRETGFFP
jgi:isopentenyl-diphosphate Delta-isomerase